MQELRWDGVNRAFVIYGLSSGWWTRCRGEPGARAQRGRTAKAGVVCGAWIGLAVEAGVGSEGSVRVVLWDGVGGGGLVGWWPVGDRR